MEITRQLPGTDEHVRIKLTHIEMEEAYRIVQKQYEIEDIKCEIEGMDEDNLYGFTYEEIERNEELLEEIHARFTKSKDCTLPYWDVMDASIEYVLEEKQKGVN